MKLALIAFCTAASNTRLLVEWSEGVSEINEKNRVALFRQLLRIYFGQNMTLATLVCDIMRMLHRLNKTEQFAEEISLLRCHFDIALQKALQNFKANGLPAALWWKDCHTYAAIVLPAEVVSLVTKCKDRWALVEQ